MATITAPGIGSGLDINGLVTQLLAAEAQAPTLRMDRREANLQVQLSGYGSIRGSLSGLQNSLSSLQNPATFQARSITSSDSDVVTVTSNGNVTEANYDIVVTTLAETQKLATDPTLAAAQFTDVTDQLGTGTLTFKFGTDPTLPGFAQNPDRATETVTITDGSLQGIRDSINQADIDVTASIIFDGSFYRLAVTSDITGEANAIQITADDNDLADNDAAGLSLLSYNDSSTNFLQTDAAVDAAFTINGIAITSASNTVTEAIESATLNLKAEGSADVSVNIDKSKVSSAITSFVTGYNDFIATINQLTSYDADTRRAGALNGDALTRGITSTVRRLISNPVGEISATLNILAEIGITTDSQTGELRLDNATLSKQLNDNFDRFVSLFSEFGVSSDAGVSYIGAQEETLIGNYAVNITTAASRGDLQASAAANLTIVENSNDSIDFTIDGISASITLTAGTYTASELVAELQSQINNATAFSNSGISVLVSESAGTLSIESQSYGSASSVSITGGNGETDLVGASATSTAGNDIAGTIGGIVATGKGQTLTGTGAADGLSLLVTGTTGARGSIDFNRGYADRLSSYLSTILQSDGVLDSTTDSIQSRIDSIGEDRENLQRRLVTIEARLRSQFSALDVLVSNLQSTSDFLTQQLDALPKIGVNNRSN